MPIIRLTNSKPISRRKEELYNSWTAFNRNDERVVDNSVNFLESVVKIFRLQTAKVYNYHISALDELSLSV